jgi:hypothetical protein
MQSESPICYDAMLIGKKLQVTGNKNWIWYKRKYQTRLEVPILQSSRNGENKQKPLQLNNFRMINIETVNSLHKIKQCDTVS